MGSCPSTINKYTQDWCSYGLMARCPNCDSRTILSYPTTVCTKCDNRFKNDIAAVNFSTYYGHFGGGITFTKFGKRAECLQQLTLKVASLPEEIGQSASVPYSLQQLTSKGASLPEEFDKSNVISLQD